VRCSNIPADNSKRMCTSMAASVTRFRINPLPTHAEDFEGVCRVRRITDDPNRYTSRANGNIRTHDQQDSPGDAALQIKAFEIADEQRRKYPLRPRLASRKGSPCRTCGTTPRLSHRTCDLSVQPFVNALLEGSTIALVVIQKSCCRSRPFRVPIDETFQRSHVGAARPLISRAARHHLNRHCRIRSSPAFCRVVEYLHPPRASFSCHGFG